MRFHGIILHTQTLHNRLESDLVVSKMLFKNVCVCYHADYFSALQGPCPSCCVTARLAYFGDPGCVRYGWKCSWHFLECPALSADSCLAF